MSTDGRVPRYARQDSTQTLQEGLAEYYALNPNLLDPQALSSAAAVLFKRHDATNVSGVTLVERGLIGLGAAVGHDPAP